MKQIHIMRNDNVTFEEVSIDVTENVFFTNWDPQEAHFPDLCDNQLGPAPSPNSSQCPVPVPSSGKSAKPPPYTVTYKCKIHPDEEGKINVFAVLAVGSKTLPQATVNQKLPDPGVQVVVGGKSPYTITGQLFQITGNNPASGSGSIGPGLQLKPDSTDNTGVWVTGTPTVVGTYNFTFRVDDAMGRNLQQVQYSMEVVV